MGIDNINKTTKRQHYVSRFYLKSFANDSGELERLYWPEGKILQPKGPKGICNEEFYYGEKAGNIDEVSQKIEEWFKNIEDMLAKCMDSVVPKILSNSQLYEVEKWHIALMMSFHWIRGPIMRKQINRMTEQMIRHVNKFTFSHPNSESLFDKFDKEKGGHTSPEMRKQIREMISSDAYNLELNNYFHFQMFDSFEKFANLFWGQDWIVYISKSDKKFTTTDNPITVVFPERKGFYGPTFLERTHYFPVNPEILIIAREPNNKMGKKIKRKTLFNADSEKILDLNMLTSSYAFKCSFARDRESLEDILREIENKEKIFYETRNSALRRIVQLTR